MNQKPLLAVCAFFLVVIAIIGMVVPMGIRSVLFNNIGSITFLHRYFNTTSVFNRSFALPTTHQRADLFQAKRALIEGDLDSAAANMTQDTATGDQVALDASANLLYMQGDYAAAVELWGKAENILALEHAAREHQGGETPEVEVLAYRALYQINPEKYTSSLAVSLKNTGQNAEAIKILEQSLSLFPGSDLQADWYRYLADIFQRQGFYEDAESAYLSALEIDPESFRAWRNLGLMFKSRQYFDFDKAIHTFWQMTQLFPQETFGFLQMGELYEGVGDFENARIVFDLALALDPGNAQAQEALQRLSQQE